MRTASVDARGVALAYFSCSGGERKQARLALADLLEEAGFEQEGVWVRKGGLAAVTEGLKRLGIKHGRKTLGSWLEGEVKKAGRLVWEDRKSREVNPEGEFDKQGRWFPSDREDGGGDGTRARAPSASWPYSCMLRCRTKEHCLHLARRSVLGMDVPPDIHQAAAPVRVQLLSALRGEKNE